jgi:hypothetical protein
VTYNLKQREKQQLFSNPLFLLSPYQLSWSKASITLKDWFCKSKSRHNKLKKFPNPIFKASRVLHKKQLQSKLLKHKRNIQAWRLQSRQLKHLIIHLEVLILLSQLNVQQFLLLLRITLIFIKKKNPHKSNK